MAVKSEEKRKLTREEAGRRGGKKVSRERGPEFYRAIGKKGGDKVAQQRGSEFYREIGRKGGESRGNKTKGTKEDQGKQTRARSSQGDKEENVNI